MTRHFIVTGPARGKGRARSTKSGHHYTPKETRLYEAHVRDCYLREHPDAAPMTGPVCLVVLEARLRPATHLRKDGSRRASAPIYPVSRPDLDNIVKSILDGLNGIAWVDDAQVVEIRASKEYGDEAFVGVRIKGLV